MADTPFTVTGSGLTAGNTVSVQMCAGLSFIEPGVGPIFFPLVFPAGSCRTLGSLTADAAGAGSTQVSLPAAAVALGGVCLPPGDGSSTSLGDPSSFSFPTPPRPDACNIVLTDDLSPADGTTPLATVRIWPGQGSGEIRGTVRDSLTGSPIGSPFPDGSAGAFQVCPVLPRGACAAVFGRSEAIAWNTDGTYAVRGLADGRYTIVFSGPGNGDFRTVDVTGGAANEGADLGVATSATRWSNSGGTAQVEVDPATALPFDAPLQVRGSGFVPGVPVNVDLCTLPIRFAGSDAGEVQRFCESGGVPATVVVPDVEGRFTTTIPFTPSRFTSQCIGWFNDAGPESLSFGAVTRCAVLATSTTGTPAGSWAEVSFARPAGGAALDGRVTVGTAPLPAAPVTVTGPTGILRRTTAADGTYRLDGLPDGTYRVTATLPPEYVTPVDPGSFSFGTDPGSFSFGSDPGSFSFGPDPRSRTTTVVITGQGDARADLAFDLPAGRVTGRVTATSGIVQFASIQAVGPNGSTGSTSPGADGVYTFAGLAAGTWQLSAQGIVSGRFVTTQRTVEVGDRPLTGIDLNFDGPAPAQISIGPSRPPEPSGWWTAPVTVGVVATANGLLLPSSLVVDGVDTGEASRTFGDGVFQVIGRSPGLATDGSTTFFSDPLLVRVDTGDPTITISTPLAGSSVIAGTPLTAGYSCADAVSGIATCSGDVPSGAPIDTTTPGPRTFTVTATDVAGRTSSSTVNFTVTPPPAPVDRVRLALTGTRTGTWDGPLTGGDLVVRIGPGGALRSVTGTGTVAGLRGGDATVAFSLWQVPFVRVAVGTIRISDPGAGIRATAPYQGRPARADDGTVSGVATWRQGRTTSRLAWSVLDGGQR
ncbi:MAG: MSCRAMM family protein [Microthrixaceae bacterium]